MAIGNLAFGALIVLSFQQQARISVGSDSKSPGEAVSLSVYFIPPGSDQKVKRIVMQVGFPSEGLTFVKFDPGISAVDAKLLPSESGRVVSLEMTAPEAIREGLLGFLVFQISPDAKPGNLPISISKAAAYTAANSEVPMQASGGSVEVLPAGSTPYIGCFFFTH